MASQAWHLAAQVPMDPAIIASEVLANAQPYNNFHVHTASPLPQYLPLANQPSSGLSGSFAPQEPPAFAFDPLGRLLRPVKPYAPSPGLVQGFVPPARHEKEFSCGQLTSSNAAQQQTSHLLQDIPKTGKAQQRTASKVSRQGSSIRIHQTGQVADVRPSSWSPDHHTGPQLPKPGGLSSFDAETRFANPTLPLPPTNNISSDSALHARQNASSSTSNIRELRWVQHGQEDPTKRSVQLQTTEDKQRKDAIIQKGGACNSCSHDKKQCDGLDHCRRCVKRKILSEAALFRSLQSPSFIPGLEKISLHDMQSPGISKNARQPDSSTMWAAQNQATDHVDSWFKNVTSMIESEPFSVDLDRRVSITIASGSPEIQKTYFNLGYLDICTHLEQKAYQLDERCLLEGFMGHASARKLPLADHGQWDSKCCAHLGWIVFNAFAFLRSFADAEMYAPIVSMSAARATVSVIYASQCRLLLSKSEELCLLVLKSLEKDFWYCTRRSRKALLKDSLHGLAQYHRVVTGLANMELRSSPEAAALFSDLRSRARAVLRNGELKKLFLQIHAKTLRKSTGSNSETGQPTFKELLSSYAAEVPNIKALSIALRVSSQHNDLPPVSTEAMRDTDPRRHYRPIKVRSLLKRSDEISMDPKQLFVNDILDGFDHLGHALSQESGPPRSGPMSSMDPALSQLTSESATDRNPSTSLNPSHASLRPSQQDTDTGSVKSESTIRNDVDIYRVDHVDADLNDKRVGNDWSDVTRRKGCKRRERSDDSQNSRRHSGQGARKHIRLNSGRESPPPYNYFGPLTHEPTTLR